jgi:hypothetical protein
LDVAIADGLALLANDMDLPYLLFAPSSQSGLNDFGQSAKTGARAIQVGG